MWSLKHKTKLLTAVDETTFLIVLVNFKAQKALAKIPKFVLNIALIIVFIKTTIYKNAIEQKFSHFMKTYPDGKDKVISFK